MKSTFLILFLLEVIICKENKENGKAFIATHEWQTIKKGQKVPNGLHYRINLSTGLTEAKLINDEDKQNYKTDLLEVPTENKNEEPTIEELKQVLKNIKSDDAKSDGKLESNFRTYEQIKNELGTLNLTSKVDAEILTDLLQRHKTELAKDTINVNTVLNILDDFDYLCHQFDNGLEFVRQNGFRDVIYKNFNSSQDVIKQSTLKLFGSLVQNNARVQIHALETGSIPILLRFLSSEESELTKSTTVFAIGCFLRRFPLAQKTFLENGGTFVILQVLERESLKIQLKIITLMTDLFVERRQALKNSSHTVLNQYQNIPLERNLLEQNWCLHVNTLLTNIVKTYQIDHDYIEKSLIAMNTVHDQCNHFNRNLLTTLQREYEKLAKTESDDDNFFKNIVELCSNILKSTKMKSEL